MPELQEISRKLKPGSDTFFWLLISLYAGLNCLLFTLDIYFLALFPFLIAVLWLLIYFPKKIVLFLAFSTPFSLKYTFEQLGLSISLPTEPLLILLMLLFWFRLFMGGWFDLKIFKHPISVAILFNLFWVFITALTSTMPIVSIKFFIARFWFVSVFFFFGVYVFRSVKNIRSFMFLFCIATCGVIFYTLTRHAQHLWEQSYANAAPNPFFPDHGVYAAVLALFLPVFIYFVFKPKVFNLTPITFALSWFILAVFSVGLIMSFTRAAWIGLGASVVMLVIFTLRIKLYQLALAAFAAIIILSFYQTEIYYKLKSNKKVSDNNLEGHVKSIYNISTDASNTERINRWESAFRMFKQKPVFGWGPGTYMFQYAPFQLSSEMTIISTNTGGQGNAHSEYIGPLAESGFPGMLSIFFIVFTSLYKSMQLMYYGRSKLVRNLSAAIILGLISYYAHGFLNNYLDMDKAAIPFFAFLSIITALDLYHNQQTEQQPNGTIS
ncbi:MAG: O-antigen ligase domain-containing protein [Sphingobacteriales bacterium]|nr:MAG: O-antigen ligase domain-containing protein [Sphingobacteriales bacterium]